MPNFDDVDLGIIGVVIIVIVVCIVRAFQELPPEFYIFASSGVGVVGALVTGRKKKEREPEKPNINV